MKKWIRQGIYRAAGICNLFRVRPAWHFACIAWSLSSTREVSPDEPSRNRRSARGRARSLTEGAARMKTVTRFGVGLLVVGSLVLAGPGGAEDHRVRDLNNLPSPMEALATFRTRAG